jgi:glycerophosphoryl diester phosphodiesterase
MPGLFDLQGHRGARGLKPENTLPSFEVALDLGVTTIETDVHMTGDAVPVLYHDPVVHDRLCRLMPGAGAPDPACRPPVSTLSLAQLRGYRADRNPDPRRFPEQDAGVTLLARLFAEQHHIDPYTPPALADLLAFIEAYAGELGVQAGKMDAQRARVRDVVRIDLELKRVPFRPGVIGDAFDGSAPAVLERQVVDIVRRAGFLQRTTVRSFDHRSVRAVRQLEPGLTTAVLVAGTAPLAPADLCRQADAQAYCPDVEFVDESQVRQLHAEGVRVVPWTVNDAANWARLLDWGVDGITTDFPDRLAALLHTRGIAF